MTNATPPHAHPPPPVLGAVARDAGELAAALAGEVARTLRDRYGQPPAQDPTLAALVHATAVHLARVYTEAERVFPEAVFDDLVAGLGMPGRAARPAQVVMGFAPRAAAELVTPDVPLAGATANGERLTFALDVPLRVSPARLVFAAVAEGGRLHVVPGATLPDDPHRPGAPALPLPSAVAPLAPPDTTLAPTLLLAFDAVDDAHLSGLGVFVDVQAADHPAARALARAAWTLVGDDAAAADQLGLRARSGPGGVWMLDWQRPPDGVGVGAAADTAGALGAPAGPYGPLCWRWPDVPPARRVRAGPPRAVAVVLGQLMPADLAARYDRPLVWVRAALPVGARGVAAAVQRVVAHAAPASNVEPFHERVDLDALGAVVAFRPEGARGRHLVRVLGISGEHGARYADEGDPVAGAAVGRRGGSYRVRGGELELHAARAPDGRPDRYVLARLLYTDGPRANGLRPGDVTGGRGAAASLTVARGGSGPPGYAPAKQRLARALRQRERVVTPADVDAAARAFDSRVLSAGARDGVEPGAAGVPPRPVLRVTAAVRHADFADGAEVAAFGAALERHLARRAPLGTAVRVAVAALERDRRAAPREDAR